MREYLEKVCLPNQNVNKIFQHLGVAVKEMHDGKAVLIMPITPCLGQGVGVVAGGILATLADEAMAHAVMSRSLRASVTVEMNIRYLKGTPAYDTGFLLAEAAILKMGRSIVVTEARIKNDKGDLLATAGASFYYTETVAVEAGETPR